MTDHMNDAIEAAAKLLRETLFPGVGPRINPPNAIWIDMANGAIAAARPHIERALIERIEPLMEFIYPPDEEDFRWEYCPSTPPSTYYATLAELIDARSPTTDQNGGHHMSTHLAARHDMSENDRDLWNALRDIQELLETVMRQDSMCVDEWDTISRFIGRRQIELSDKVDLRRDVLTVSLTRNPQT